MYALVSQWQESGLTQVAFCNERKLSVKTFQYWLRKLRSENQSPDFVPVAVDRPDIDSTIEIAYPSGVRLLIRHGISTGELKSLLTLI